MIKINSRERYKLIERVIRIAKNRGFKLNRWLVALQIKSAKDRHKAYKGIDFTIYYAHRMQRIQEINARNSFYGLGGYLLNNPKPKSWFEHEMDDNTVINMGVTEDHVIYSESAVKKEMEIMNELDGLETKINRVKNANYLVKKLFRRMNHYICATLLFDKAVLTMDYGILTIGIINDKQELDFVRMAIYNTVTLEYSTEALAIIEKAYSMIIKDEDPMYFGEMFSLGLTKLNKLN